jgi:hypothetical protein
MKQILLMIAVVALVGCGEKQEETQGPSQPEPATPPQATEKPKSPKAIWGQSKSIEVVRNHKIGDSGKTLGKAIASSQTGVKWKSKRGKSREEVIIACTGDFMEDGKTYKTKIIWVVNKEYKSFKMTDISIDGEVVPKDDWLEFLEKIL